MGWKENFKFSTPDIKLLFCQDENERFTFGPLALMVVDDVVSQYENMLSKSSSSTISIDWLQEFIELQANLNKTRPRNSRKLGFISFQVKLSHLIHGYECRKNNQAMFSNQIVLRLYDKCRSFSSPSNH